MFNDWQQALAAEELPLEAIPEAELAAAARRTARNSRDKDDLALLLEAIGVPTDTDTITALLPLIPDPADTDPTDPADTTGTTGDDPDMTTTTVPEKAKTALTAEEAMAVSMYFAHRPIGDIIEMTGLSEQRIRRLADAAEAESDALQMAVEGRTTADIAAAVDLPEAKVTDLIDAAPITPTHPQTPASTTAGTAADTPAGTDKDPVAAGTIGVLLAWAEKHDLASIRSRAARIRTDLAELSDRRNTEQATAQAEARVAELKAQLEAAQSALRAVKSGTARPTPTPGAGVGIVPVPSPAVGGKRSREELARVRAWARENGYQVGVAGIVKKAILDAYDAAHQAPAQAV
jgi:hypothetical protein